MTEVQDWATTAAAVDLSGCQQVPFEATMTILSTGDLVTDEKVDEYEGAEFDELIEVSGHPSTRVVIEDGSDCVVIDDKVYSIAELLELMEVLPRALRVAIDNT